MNVNEQKNRIRDKLNNDHHFIKFNNSNIFYDYYWGWDFSIGIRTKHFNATIVGLQYLSDYNRKQIRLSHFYKYRNGSAYYYLMFKNKYYELEHETITTRKGFEYYVPIIPQFLFEYEKEQEAKEKAKIKEKKLKKYNKELSISSFSGKLLLEGIDSEVTLVDNILFIHNFGESFLRINEKENIFTLSISRHHSKKEYMKLGDYSEEEAIQHISNFYKIGFLK